MLLQDYQDEWPAQFQQIREVLQEVLAAHCQSIEHIGSTSVPGLAAKPIIDIDIVYKNPTDFAGIKSALEKLGYYHNGNQGIKDRAVFKRNNGEKHPVLDQIPHHLYACPSTSEELNRHLLFRNYLRKNPAARAQYQALKHQIATTAGQDRKRYAQLKEEQARSMIESLLTLAQEI